MELLALTSSSILHMCIPFQLSASRVTVPDAAAPHNKKPLLLAGFYRMHFLMHHGKRVYK